jgi:hypothetical protein
MQFCSTVSSREVLLVSSFSIHKHRDNCLSHYLTPAFEMTTLHNQRHEQETTGNNKPFRIYCLVGPKRNDFHCPWAVSTVRINSTVLKQLNVTRPVAVSRSVAAIRILRPGLQQWESNHDSCFCLKGQWYEASPPSALSALFYGSHSVFLCTHGRWQQ